MNKAVVDGLISDMKKAGIVTKASPWTIEGMGEREMNVRYVGIKPHWEDIFSPHNNLLLKFIISRTESSMDIFLANKTPFLFICKRKFMAQDKWETLLGEVKRKLAKDREDVIHHTEKIGNWYSLIQSALKD